MEMIDLRKIYEDNMEFKKAMCPVCLPELHLALDPKTTEYEIPAFADLQNLHIFLTLSLNTGDLMMSFVGDGLGYHFAIQTWVEHNGLLRGKLFMDVSGREFMNLVLDKIIDEFKTLLEEIKKDREDLETLPLKEFYEVVLYRMGLLDECEWEEPGWLNSTEIELGELIDDYTDYFEERIPESYRIGDDPFDYV